MSMQAIIAARDYAQATGAAYALLLVIADGVDSKSDTMRGRSVEKLARLAHLHRFDATEEQKRNARRRCQRLIAQLIASGELIVETGGYRTKSAYHIPILAGELGYDPQPCDDETHDCNKFHTPLTIVREDESIAEADKRMNAEKMRRRVPTYTPREAAPEPPQTRPIDRPPAKTPREAAPEPPQTRPIDHGGVAPEPPQTRPLGRRVSHISQNTIPGDIPDALTRDLSSSINQDERTEPETESDTLPPPSPPLSLAAIWRTASRSLHRGLSERGALSASEWDNWIAPIRLCGYDDETGLTIFTLTAPGSYAAEMLTTRYRDALIYALAKAAHVQPGQVGLQIVANSKLKRA